MRGGKRLLGFEKVACERAVRIRVLGDLAAPTFVASSVLGKRDVGELVLSPLMFPAAASWPRLALGPPPPAFAEWAARAAPLLPACSRASAIAPWNRARELRKATRMAFFAEFSTERDLTTLWKNEIKYSSCLFV